MTLAALGSYIAVGVILLAILLGILGQLNWIVAGLIIGLGAARLAQ